MIHLLTTDTDIEVKNFISTIQNLDSDAKVTVIFNDLVDVEDEKIYNNYLHH